MDSSKPSSSDNSKRVKITRFPFINYLAVFRRNNPKISTIESAKQAGACWRKMSMEEKKRYRDEAASAPRTMKRRRSTHRKSKTYRRKRSARSSRSTSSRTSTTTSSTNRSSN
ncbi:hypothetical protein RI129_008390 [Pyrocoelia pectoralis]|uniref:HMG box domain-containing protein n=1 Tax=Pyrocoelia pectoralis TaxID=417401 RepID=A0AAN7V8J8_9COLE